MVDNKLNSHYFRHMHRRFLNDMINQKPNEFENVKEKQRESTKDFKNIANRKKNSKVNS